MCIERLLMNFSNASVENFNAKDILMKTITINT